MIRRRAQAGQLEAAASLPAAKRPGPGSFPVQQAKRLGPWLLFFGLLFWRWHAPLFTTIPGYGDALEVAWGIRWYATALTTPGVALGFYANAFYPEGWQVATFAYGPALLLPLAGLSGLGGVAFAYNAGAILTQIIAFAGTLRLGRLFTGSLLVATLVALLYTFWGFRWVRAFGHMNILLGSALLPWIAWSLERGMRSNRCFSRWALLAGLFWALAVSAALYFIWIGGLIVLVWL
ncbi:MAG: hypothetical protein ACRDHL_08820, partial [Candidatus Promineifilaceae bacterium]